MALDSVSDYPYLLKLDSRHGRREETAPLDMPLIPQELEGRPDRGDPRLWQHDYLHLRSIAGDLRNRIGAAASGRVLPRVLDLASGSAPYREYFGKSVGEYVRLDASAACRPSLLAGAESLPFSDGSFDAVLSTQALGLVDDPIAAGREIERILRPGGLLWLTTPAHYPFDAARAEHRFGEPELRRLFPGLAIREIVTQGGMLALPFVCFNIAVREAGRSISRRVGMDEFALEPPASFLYVVSNLLGRGLEMLAEGGPFSTFLTYLDRRLPMNYLVVAEKPR